MRAHQLWATAALAFIMCPAPSTCIVAKIDLYRKNSQLDKLKSRAARNVLYYGSIALGDPGQDLTVCFDTGSADLWVPSAVCENPSCLTHNRFDELLSRTQDNGGQFSIKYGTGTVHGKVVTDVLRFSEPPVVVPDQGFGLATESSADFESASCDGIFGLALPSLSKQGQMPAFFRMLEGNMLDEPLFSIWLSPDPTTEPAGKIMFGGHNPQRYIGDLVDLPVISRKYWMVGLDAVAVGGQKVPQLKADGAIMDTGTSLITTSAGDAMRINSLIPGMTFSPETNTWRLEEGCDVVDSLPAVSFVMGGTSFSLGPRQYIIQVGAGEDTYCMSGIAGNGPEGKVVMGASFLRAYYSVYTYDLASSNAWVSLAPAAIDTGVDSEGVEITSAAAEAGEPLTASTVFVAPTRSEKSAVGMNWTAALQKAPQASSPTGAAAAEPAVAPAPAAIGAQVLIGTVMSVSGGQPGPLLGTAAGSSGAPDAADAASAAAYAAPDGQVSVAMASAVTPPVIAPMPDQTASALQSNAPSRISKDLSSTPDHIYSAALAATTYMGESGGSASPPSAPAGLLSVARVSSFGLTSGGRRRLRS